MTAKTSQRFQAIPYFILYIIFVDCNISIKGEKGSLKEGKPSLHFPEWYTVQLASVGLILSCVAHFPGGVTHIWGHCVTLKKTSQSEIKETRK